MSPSLDLTRRKATRDVTGWRPAAAGIVALAPATCAAAEYPEKPVRIMRIISPKLGDASRAAPDGYTLAAMIASNASNPSVMKTVPYCIPRTTISQVFAR